MVRFGLFSLAAASLLHLTGAIPAAPQSSAKPAEISEKHNVFSQTDDYPLANPGNVVAHDPNIFEYNDSLYLFKGGVHIDVMKASNISGPWTHIGSVLSEDSMIDKVNRTRPWAPTTVQYNNKFYVFYCVSHTGSRNSAIGIASSDNIEGPWTDHGALVNTEKGENSHVFPYTETNAIDPSFIVDQSTGKPYLTYGSYWHGIWQVPLSDDLLSVENPESPDAINLAFIPDEKLKPQEGSFMTYREPYYYTWYSHGKCCDFNHGFPKMGQEYEIRVGRSENARGPFVDKDGKNLTEGGGTTVYGSNHGIVYAPGGLGVLNAKDDRPDILYYHYLNTTIGFKFLDAHLGYSYLDYQDGWPVAQDSANGTSKSSGSTPRANYSPNLLLLTCMCCLILILMKRRLVGLRLIAVFLVICTFFWIYQ